MSHVIAVLGLGVMGSAIAATLIDDGAEVVVWNRKAEKAQRLRELGAGLPSAPQPPLIRRTSSSS